MSIWLWYGEPGAGKNFCVVSSVLEDVKRGRNCYANFAIDGCKLALDLRDVGCEAFRGARCSWDEVGTSYSARDTFNSDAMLLASLSQHRHLETDVDLMCQHPMFADVQARRLCEFFIEVVRIGPDGKELARPGREAPRHWWERWLEGFRYLPRGFECRAYRTRDLGSEGEVRTGAEPAWSQYVKFNRRTAGMYNTQQVVIPQDLADAWAEQERTAWARAASPIWHVKRSVREPLAVPDGWAVTVPPVVLHDRSKKKLQVDVAAVLAPLIGKEKGSGMELIPYEERT